MMRRTVVLVLGLLFALPCIVAAQVDKAQVDKSKLDPAYLKAVYEEYAACTERNDLDQIQELLWYHRNVERIDASVYGLPKDDFDDRSRLTIEERLKFRADKQALGQAIPTSGEVQYPHFLREALDHMYETSGERVDCSQILQRAGIPNVEDTYPPKALSLGVTTWTTDKNITAEDVQNRGEVNIAIDHANPARMIASSVGTGALQVLPDTPDNRSNFIAYTSDFGQTWGKTEAGLAAGADWACDPISYYDRNRGWVYHGAIECDTASCNDTEVRLRYSTDGGANWLTSTADPGESALISEDRPWFTIDNSPQYDSNSDGVVDATNPCYQRIHVTWHNSNMEKVATAFNASFGHNSSQWTPVFNVTATAQAITPDINTAADGKAYLVWQNHGDSTFRFARMTGSGCGGTYNTTGNWTAAPGISLGTRNGAWSNSLLAQCSRGVGAQPYVDVDRAPRSQRYGTVYVLLNQFNNACTSEAAWNCSKWQTDWNATTCNYDLFLRKSTDFGTTWSAATNITSGDGNYVDNFMGYMRVDEADGSIYVSYHRTLPNPTTWSDRAITEYVVTRSTNGGTNWETPIVVSDYQSSEWMPGYNVFERGDYNHIEAFNGVAWPIWIDRRAWYQEEDIIVRKLCAEPTHSSQRLFWGTAVSPTTTCANAAGGQVSVTWPHPDVYWGDGNENTTARKYQLWVDGALATDTIVATTNSTIYDPPNCLAHNYVVRAVNQCGIGKDYSTASFSSTCCGNNPTTVDILPNGPLSICAGKGKLLTAVTSGGTGMTYQWLEDGTAIAGATSSTYVAANTGTHTYNCRVTGSGCANDIREAAGGTDITWVAAPAFTGVNSVSTISGGDCGLRVEWSPVSSLCDGSVVYNVYRSSTAGFTPGSANLIASCVTDTSFDDTSTVTGNSYYYVVRAEDPVPGGGGPCANGTEDTNTKRLMGTAVGGTTGLYSENFDGWSDGDWAGWDTFSAGGSDSWEGVQTCTASSSPNVFRFGANGDCTSTYDYNAFSLAYPNIAPVNVPAGSTACTATFNHKYRFGTYNPGDNDTDGGMLYLSHDGLNFSYVNATYVTGTQTYNGYAGGLAGFAGQSGGLGWPYRDTSVDLSTFCTNHSADGFAASCAGQSIYLGFGGYSSGYLFDQTRTIPTSAYGYPCHNLGPSYPTYTSEGADDFTVPANKVWTVKEAYVPGFWSPPSSTSGACYWWGCFAQKMQVSFYNDDGTGGAPNTAVTGCSYNITRPNFDEIAGEFYMIFDPPCTLNGTSAGNTFYMSFDEYADYQGNDQWWWYGGNASGVGAGPNPSYWRNPGNGFGTGCTAWSQTHLCLNATNSTTYIHFPFVIYGDETGADGWFVDNVQLSCNTGATCNGTMPSPVQFFTATSTNTQNKLEWQNPASYPIGATTVIRASNSTYPTSPTDGTLVYNGTAGGAGVYYNATHSSLLNDQRYYYSAFVVTAGGDYSSRMTVSGRPQVVSGTVKWAFNNGASSLTPPGIGSGTSRTMHLVSNDRAVHSVTGGTGSTSGMWPMNWLPRAMNAPAQDRPPIVKFPDGHREVYLGSQDGRVYSIYAANGTLKWNSTDFGMVQGAPAGMFSHYGGAYDLIFAGTRNSGADNVLYGLSVGTGATVWTFNNGGGAGNGIGIISAKPTVDYANNKVYFTSRASTTGGSSRTLWCVSFTGGTATLCSSWPALALGDIDGGVMQEGNILYVGTNNSRVYAINATTGAIIGGSYYDCLDGPVKGFVWADPSSTYLYVSTTNKLWSLNDGGGTAVPSLRWQVTSIPNPSTPLVLIGSGLVMVGSSDGYLYQVDAAGSTIKSQMLGEGSAAVGSPALDVANSLVYVGTENGAAYAASVPLP